MSFGNKRMTVVITGAAGELGSKFAERFAKALSPESLLILSSRSRTQLEPLKESLTQSKPGLNVGLTEWDLNKVDTKRFEADLKSLTNNCGNFDHAIIVHNAALLGDMNHRVASFGHHLNQIQEVLNVNLIALLALNTAFLEVFNGVPATIVSLTAPSATRAAACFGYAAICKASTHMVLNVLALEEPNVKVLHYDPVLVDTKALRVIRDQSHDEAVRNKFKTFYQENHVLSGKLVADSLVKLLVADKYESGGTVSALEAQGIS